MGALKNESKKFIEQRFNLKKIEETLHYEVTLILNSNGQTYLRVITPQNLIEEHPLQ